MKPNVLIVIIDSLRADHVGCYGYHRPTTPNIDRIAAEGCLFETCITAAPFSPASYASIFSNRYPHQHGVNGDTVRVWPDSWPRLPELMKERGYYTFGVSDNSFVSAEMNATRGFDAFIGLQHGWFLRQYHRLQGRSRRILGHAAANRLEINHLLCSVKGDSRQALRNAVTLIERGPRPFFGFVILMDPHAPYNATRREFWRNPRHARNFLRKVNGREMWPRMMAHRRTLPPELFDAAIDFYDGEVHHADRCVGELYHCLGKAGLLEDTILAVAADHGEAFGEYGVWGHGFCLDDCLTRVPLVLRCPRYWRPSTRCESLVQLHDLHDTCLSVAAAPEPQVDKHPHGLTQNSNRDWMGRDLVFSEFPTQTKTLALLRKINPRGDFDLWAHDMWSVRSPHWRYVDGGNGECTMYSVANPREERNGPEAVDPNVREWLSHRLDMHRRDTILPGTRPQEGSSEAVDGEVLDRLRSLGYVE
jgi:arylsulfatase A-like enzyme